MTSRDEALRALEKAVELVAKATPGPWEALTPCEPNDYVTDIRSDDDGQLVAAMYTEHDGRLVAAAVNFIREHGAALLSPRQEVAPVAYRKLVKTPFGTYWDLSNVMDADHAISTGATGYEPLYTSTGQTSDARDALDRVDSVLREFESMTGAGYKYMAANIRAAIKGPK